MTDMEQQQKEVRKKALKLLEHMDRTEKGLYDRLLRAGFSEALAADAVAYVKDYGYVNDARYATNYIMYRIHDKSHQKIFQELQQKGIDRQTIQSAWDEAAELEMPDNKYLRSLHIPVFLHLQSDLPLQYHICAVQQKGTLHQNPCSGLPVPVLIHQLT